VLGGALAGAAGSVASQGFGLISGIQDKFDWKSAALAGISGGVGGGLGAALGATGIAGSKFLTDVARGAGGSAITQGIGLATGLQDKFDWAGVAAAGLGAGVGGAVSRSLALKFDDHGMPLSTPDTWNMPDGFGHSAAVSAADALAQATARSLIEGTSFGDNLLAALPSAIGNTIGNALARAVNPGNRAS